MLAIFQLQKMKNLILYLLLISTLLSFSFSLSETCNPQDKKALLQIKKDFGNPYLLASWKSDTDCCHWYQVECDSTTHRIIALTIFAGELSGQLPPAIGDLPYLHTLEFHKLTNVTGPIQPTIAKLEYLTFLRLSWLNLTGSVPEFLSQLKNLNFLDLAFNSLSGSIPSSLALLPNLDAIHLDRNKLTGTIPASFGAFQGKVPSIYLSHNQLSGEIPASLGNLDFYVIDFSRNKLEGDASMLFGPNKTTQTIDLSRNLLEFDLSKVVFPASLGLLDLNHNKIYGSIPEEMTKLSLQLFNVSYNRLCGQIPVGGKLQSFDYSTYFHNRCLCGTPLPSCK
ncbi:polygalacturonase inhibitor-like [Euphorbia lathyris]|uniref:polygalacturonase inhibitor-like n=1 Tax=Euphorbia lathyris TaxID=212925 RepID=UPI00331337EA